MATATGVGPLLREWRTRRRMSQLDLALDAGVSARHVSFVETGRSTPSREMVLHLAEELGVPLRDRNRLLTAAGYAPVYEQHDLGDPQMKPVRDALDVILTAHEPYPVAVVNTQWELIAQNRGIALLVEGVAPELLEPPVNVLRLSLHPDGMAPRIRNLGEWRGHLLARLRRQIQVTGDPALQTLFDEVNAYPGDTEPSTNDLFVPLRIDDMTFLSTITTFGTPVDITLEELSIEAFFPADAATSEVIDSIT
jgi:transcriptional regulator with XRE-family HTH domain